MSAVRRSIMLVRDTNFFQKAESKSRILGDVNSIPSGGGVPEFGVPAKYHSEARTLCGVSVMRGSLTPMSGDGSFVYFPEHDVTLERALPLQDEQPIQSVPKQAAHSERVPPSMASCRSD